jgi:RimJ/RimL family protein N-acetyltransferase
MIQTPSIHGPILRLTPFNLAGPVMRFSIHQRDNNRRVGILLITALDGKSGHASLEMLVADPTKRVQYGSEILQLALQVAFCERKLHRITVRVPEFDDETIHLIEQTGFILEARQRQAIFLRGRYWDELIYGLLETDWQVRVQYESVSLPLEGTC